MPVNFDQLPFDILFNIVPFLDFESIINVAYTCRSLSAILHESTLCRKVLETHAKYSYEAVSAREHRISYEEATKRLHLRRKAFAAAAPRTARFVGYGSDIFYRQGVLCSIQGSRLRVVDLRGDFGQEEYNLCSLVSGYDVDPSDEPPRFSLLYYGDGIVSLHYFPTDKQSTSQIVALDIRPKSKSLRFVVATVLLPVCDKLFVRHTDRYLYYGTHSGRGDHGHDEWIIRGISLDPDYPLPETARVQLRDFVGSDIGSTVAFEIHDSYFYALSNQTSFDVEEVDWTSLYHCIRFPLDDPRVKTVQTLNEIFRRQHEEGAINDSWTDLSLQVDERTNELQIVEARREWVAGSSEQARTFYIRNIPFSEPKGDGKDSSDRDEDGSGNVASITPPPPPVHPTDALAVTIGSRNNYHYAPSERRHPDNVHREYGFEGDTARFFILSRTKFKSYNTSCRAFLDVVEDTHCCLDKPGSSCLRLRIGSRLPDPLYPLEDEPVAGPCKGSLFLKLGERPIQKYRYQKIKMWPPPAATSPKAKEMHDLMNTTTVAKLTPGRQLETICAMDERSLVVLRRVARPKTEEERVGKIILISFDAPNEAKVTI